MKRTILKSALAAAAGLGFGVAQAAPVAGLFNDAPQNTLLSDNSAEYWIDVDGSNTVNTNDILFGILSIGDIQGTQIGGVTGFNEVTIIQANKITGEGVPTVNVQGVTINEYTASALTAADANYFDWSTGTIDLDGNPGTVADQFTFTTALGAANDGNTLALVFEDGANNATRETDIQTGLNVHTDGMARLLVTLDTTVDAGDTVVVDAPVNPFAAAATIGTTNTAIQGSSFFLDGTIAVDAWPNLAFNSEITAGTGGFSTPSGTTSWPIFDNIDFTVTATKVPAPAGIALLGLGLIGMVGLRRFKRA